MLGSSFTSCGHRSQRGHLNSWCRPASFPADSLSNVKNIARSVANEPTLRPPAAGAVGLTEMIYACYPFDTHGGALFLSSSWCLTVTVLWTLLSRSRGARPGPRQPLRFRVFQSTDPKQTLPIIHEEEPRTRLYSRARSKLRPCGLRRQFQQRGGSCQKVPGKNWYRRGNYRSSQRGILGAAKQGPAPELPPINNAQSRAQTTRPVLRKRRQPIMVIGPFLMG